MCVCLLLVRAKAKIKGNEYGATRSAGDYRRKVQLARLCALGGKDMVGEVKCVKEGSVRGVTVCVYVGMLGRGRGVETFVTKLPDALQNSSNSGECRRAGGGREKRRKRPPHT